MPVHVETGAKTLVVMFGVSGRLGMRSRILIETLDGGVSTQLSKHRQAVTEHVKQHIPI